MSKLPKVLNRFQEVIHATSRVCCWIAGIFLVVLVLVVAIDVIGRKLGYPVEGSTDIEAMLLVPIAFLAMAAFVLLPAILNLEIPEVVLLVGFCALEVVLLAWVIKSKLGRPIVAVSDRQLVLGCNVLALISVVVFGFTFEGAIVRSVINGALILFVVVYFVTKSVLSRRVRLEILLGLLVPVCQFLLRFS